MCGRYTLTSSAAEVAAHFGVPDSERTDSELPESDLPGPTTPEAEVPELALEPRYNIAPTQRVPVVRVDAGRRRLEARHWGLIPHWAKDAKIGARLINARSETVAEKPAFRDAFRRRRCLLPADGFYEWKAHPRRRRPHYIQLPDGALFAFAGLYADWTAPDGSRLASCTLLTTQANSGIAPLHARMPVILAPEAYSAWLDPELREPDAVAALLTPRLAEQLTYHPVGWQVNRPAHDAPDCCEAVQQPPADEVF